MMVALLSIAAFAATQMLNNISRRASVAVTYALSEGDTFTSGQTVEVKEGNEIVATITYGEAGGADFKAAKADSHVEGFTAFTEGNGVNGNKAGGTWYTIKPTYAGSIDVAVVLNADKAFYIEEDGTALTDYNGITKDAKYYGTFTFNVSAGKSYKIYCSGSKLGFYGFKYAYTTMEPVANIAELTALENGSAFTFNGTATIQALIKKGNATYCYIKDETGSSLIYDSKSTLTANLAVGKKIAAGWNGSVSVYNDLFEAVPNAELTTTDDAAVVPVFDEVTLADVKAENVNKIVKLTNVTVAGVSGSDFKIKKGDDEVVGYNQFAVTDLASGLVCSEMIGAIGIYKGAIQFQPISFTVGTPAPAPADVTIDPADGADISEALATATELCAAKAVTVNLAADANYTISKPIVATADVVINGNGATIDASALASNMIQWTAKASDDTEWTKADITISGVTVKGLKKALFYSNGKYYYGDFSLDNSVIELAADVTAFDYTKGSTAVNFTVTNSTIYASTATTKSLYSSQGGQKTTEWNAKAVQTFKLTGNTMYNLAKAKNFFSHRQSNQKWMTYDVQNNIFVNCGKSGQTIKGMNGGSSGANPTWIIKCNSFNFDGVDTSADEATGDEAEPVQDNVPGVVAFADAANGDFTILRTSAQYAKKVGDPRWIKPAKKQSDAVYDFAAAAEAGENPENMNGSTKNGGVFCGWESVSKTDSKRQDYRGYQNYTGTNLPEECHVWRRSDRINNNVKDGGLFCPADREMAINNLESGDKIVIDFDATNAAGDKLLWVPGKGAEPQAVAVVGKSDRSAVSGITQIASGDTIFFINGAKDYFVFKVLKNMVIKKITIIATNPNVVDFKTAYGVYADPKAENQHGTITADIPAAVEGETVTLSCAPEKGYSFVNYVVKDAEGNSIEMTGKDQFVMPAGDVFVSAVYNVLKDLTVELTESCNISDEVAKAIAASAAEEPGTEVNNLTIKLFFNTAYTITNTIEVSGAIKLIGENSTIDASGLTQPMIQMNKEPVMAPVTSGQYIIEDSILIEGVLVEGLTKALFFDNGKSYTYKNFIINNSVFQYDTQDNVVLNLAASMAINLNITNSTFWNKGASGSNFIAMSGKRPWQTTGFEEETGKFLCANNTFYNIAKNKQFFNTNTLKGQKYLYEFNSNIFVNTSNKKIYGNMTNNKKQLTTDEKNTYLWGELNYSDPEYEGVFFSETGYNGDEGLITDPKFVDADKGDFTLGIGSKQQKYETGDPRWLTYFDPAFAEVENVNLTLTDGAEISSALAKYIYEKGIDKVGQITILLETGDYTIENSIEAPNTFVLLGLSTTTKRAKVDASKLDGPFVLMSKEPTLKTNEKGAFIDGCVVFMGVDINNLKQQLVYANKTQYLMDIVGVSDCVIGVDGTAKKTIFDFNGGGNTKELQVLNSTIWANPTNGQNGGFFSSQGSKDVRELDETATQMFKISNSTLYNITNGKTVNTLRKNSQEYQQFIVTNNIIVNSGKSNQFLKGLNAGQAGKDVNWEVDSNVFNFDGAISEEQQIGSTADNIKNTINVLVQFKDAENGDFTQGYVKDTEAGDPRWYDENAVTAIETVKGDVERAADGAWYTIQGVRVDKPSKGIFIHNGKKVVVK